MLDPTRLNWKLEIHMKVPQSACGISGEVKMLLALHFVMLTMCGKMSWANQKDQVYEVSKDLGWRTLKSGKRIKKH